MEIFHSDRDITHAVEALIKYFAMQRMPAQMQCNALQCNKVLADKSKKRQITYKLASSCPQLGPNWPKLALS